MIPMTNPRNKITVEVIRVSSQDQVIATINAVIINDVNSKNVPSFSDMPSCSVLAVLVIVPAAEPEGIESNTCIDWAKRASKKSRRIAADIRIPIRRKQNFEECRQYMLILVGNGFLPQTQKKGEWRTDLVDVVQSKSNKKQNEDVQRKLVQSGLELVHGIG